jgi:hypothetical protein
MKGTLEWLLLSKPNPKWRSTTKVVSFVWLMATSYPAFRLYDAMPEEDPRGPLHTRHAWILLIAWAVSYVVVLQIFVNLTRLWDRVDTLEKELASLRSGQPKGIS